MKGTVLKCRMCRRKEAHLSRTVRFTLFSTPYNPADVVVCGACAGAHHRAWAHDARIIATRFVISFAEKARTTIIK